MRSLSTALQSSPCSPQLEKSPSSDEDPAQLKVKKKKKKIEPLARRKGINTITHSPVGRGLGSTVQPEVFHLASQSPRLLVVLQQMEGGRGRAPGTLLSPTLFRERVPTQVSGEWGVSWGMVCGRPAKISATCSVSVCLETVRAGRFSTWWDVRRAGLEGWGREQHEGGGSTWEEHR